MSHAGARAGEARRPTSGSGDSSGSGGELAAAAAAATAAEFATARPQQQQPGGGGGRSSKQPQRLNSGRARTGKSGSADGGGGERGGYGGGTYGGGRTHSAGGAPLHAFAASTAAKFKVFAEKFKFLRRPPFWLGGDGWPLSRHGGAGPHGPGGLGGAHALDAACFPLHGGSGSAYGGDDSDAGGPEGRSSGGGDGEARPFTAPSSPPGGAPGASSAGGNPFARRTKTPTAPGAPNAAADAFRRVMMLPPGAAADAFRRMMAPATRSQVWHPHLGLPPTGHLWIWLGRFKRWRKRYFVASTPGVLLFYKRADCEGKARRLVAVVVLSSSAPGVAGAGGERGGRPLEGRRSTAQRSPVHPPHPPPPTPHHPRQVYTISLRNAAVVRERRVRQLKILAGSAQIYLRTLHAEDRDQARRAGVWGVQWGWGGVSVGFGGVRSGRL